MAYQSYDMIGEVLFERVEDADAVRVYGVNHKEVRSIGCYSQGQAQRLGRWILETERYLTQTVSFSVSQDAGVVFHLVWLYLLQTHLKLFLAEVAVFMQQQ